LSDEQREGTEILAVSVDDLEKQQLMIDRVAAEDGIFIEFPLLSDPDHLVIDRYGLFNVDDPRGREIAHPATYVIDREGVVRYAFVEEDHRVRPENEVILEALAALHP
jgi:peroxiredoxin